EPGFPAKKATKSTFMMLINMLTICGMQYCRPVKKHQLSVIAPTHHRRIAAGILSWGQDMDQEILPFQANLAYQVPRHKEADYIGKTKLEKVRAQLDAGDYPFTHQLVGMVLGGAEIDDYAPDFWLISESWDAEPIGYITSPWYSPELNQNIA